VDLDAGRASVTFLPPGNPLQVGWQVAEGDPEVPFLIRLEALDGGGWIDRRSPKLQHGAPVASFGGLAAGDYRVTVEPAVVMADIPAVWELLIVVNPRLESSST
jgi:hypothetical protein